MKKYILSFLILIAAFASVDAQSLLRRAEIAYQERNYRSAADAYEKHCSKNEDVVSEVCIPLANSYYHLGEYANAKKYYDKTREREMSAQEFFNYGELLRKQGLYSEAMQKYTLAKKNRKKNVSTSRINLGIKACEWAMSNESANGKGRATVSPSGLETRGQSFGLQFYENGVVYSSAGSGKLKNVDANGKPILNLAYATSSSDSSGVHVAGFSKTLLSKEHVGSADFSADGKTIFYTKLVALKESSKLKIYTARLNAELGDWVRESELSFCDDKYNFAHPALSLDGKILYFSSDMDGTLGGMDIFKVEKNGKVWGKPQNLGCVVNTEATEIFPYITPSGFLSFASNGQPGFGGLDAFWVKMENGVPVSIKNASTPINSTYDDFAAVIDPGDTLSAYVSSNRSSLGSYDSIYTVKLTEEYVAEMRGVNIDSMQQVAYEDSVMTVQLAAVADSIAYADSMMLIAEVDQQQNESTTVVQEDAFVQLKPDMLFAADELGVVNTFLVDALSLKPLENASYVITENKSKKVLLSGVANSSSIVSLDFKSVKALKNQPLTVTAEVEYGSFSSYSLELVSNRMRSYDKTHPIMLTPIMAKRDKIRETIVADEFVTGGAPFSFDGYTLTKAGMIYLDTWADFLIKNPTVKIKLMTHTDGRGEVSYNFKLSQSRAFEAKQYLITKGVGHMQVIARGYGERYPLVNCKECSEEEHDTNRRIEMEVINKK